MNFNSLTIVSREKTGYEKAGKFKAENNGAVVYVESSLTVQNPLFFFVRKFWLNKLMRTM